MFKLRSLFILFIFFSNFSFSQEKTLKISVGEWPPYITQDLKYNGVIAHLITDILSDMGYSAKFKFYSWPRAYKEANIGHDDLTGIWIHKKEREKDFYYSDSILAEKFVFFHLKETKFNWLSIQDLKGINLIGMLGYSYGPEIDAAIKSNLINLNNRVSTTKQAFGMILRKRAQLYPQEVNIGNYYLKKNDIKDITYNKKPYLTNNSYLLFPERNKFLLKGFNLILNKYKESGKYDEYFTALDNGFYAEK